MPAKDVGDSSVGINHHLARIRPCPGDRDHSAIAGESRAAIACTRAVRDPHSGCSGERVRESHAHRLVHEHAQTSIGGLDRDHLHRRIIQNEVAKVERFAVCRQGAGKPGYSGRHRVVDSDRERAEIDAREREPAVGLGLLSRLRAGVQTNRHVGPIGRSHAIRPHDSADDGSRVLQSHLDLCLLTIEDQTCGRAKEEQPIRGDLQSRRKRTREDSGQGESTGLPHVEGVIIGPLRGASLNGHAAGGGGTRGIESDTAEASYAIEVQVDHGDIARWHLKRPGGEVVASQRIHVDRAETGGHEIESERPVFVGRSSDGAAALPPYVQRNTHHSGGYHSPGLEDLPDHAAGIAQSHVKGQRRAVALKRARIGRAQETVAEVGAHDHPSFGDPHH